MLNKVELAFVMPPVNIHVLGTNVTRKCVFTDEKAFLIGILFPCLLNETLDAFKSNTVHMCLMKHGELLASEQNYSARDFR